MFETPPAVKLTAEQRNTLEAWVDAPRTPQKIVLRSRICLLAAEGKPNQVIARELKTSRPTVILWRYRFEARGSAGIAEDAPHGRSSRRTQDELVERIV
jgi:transposase